MTRENSRMSLKGRSTLTRSLTDLYLCSHVTIRPKRWAGIVRTRNACRRVFFCPVDKCAGTKIRSICGKSWDEVL